jgi:HK97 family phage major capsid protein
MAIDEDRVFTIGNGVGVPLGILPGGLNSNGFTEVNSGSASALTTSGVKKLKRGLASQYRMNGVFIANSDTYGDIELLTTSGTGSDFAFGSLSEGDVLLRRPALETGFMPDVAGNAFPLIFCNPAGYYIVEVPGMTVARLQDTATSINKVEIHVMKLLGGRPVEPWNFAVQKVAS